MNLANEDPWTSEQHSELHARLRRRGIELDSAARVLADYVLSQESLLREHELLRAYAEQYARAKTIHEAVYAELLRRMGY